MIDDDAHGAFGGMRADIDQRAREALIQHRRHGDQHLAVQITAPALCRRTTWQFHARKVSRSFANCKRTARSKFHDPPPCLTADAMTASRRRHGNLPIVTIMSVVWARVSP